MISWYELDVTTITESVDVFDHHGVEVVKADLAILVAIRLLNHQPEGLLLQALLDMTVHLLEVVDSQVVFVIPVVFLEDGGDELLVLVAVRLALHRLHEFHETYPTGLLNIEFGHYFVGGLFVGIEPVLAQEQFDVIGQ